MGPPLPKVDPLNRWFYLILGPTTHFGLLRAMHEIAEIKWDTQNCEILFPYLKELFRKRILENKSCQNNTTIWKIEFHRKYDSLFKEEK